MPEIDTPQEFETSIPYLKTNRIYRLRASGYEIQQIAAGSESGCLQIEHIAAKIGIVSEIEVGVGVSSVARIWNAMACSEASGWQSIDEL